MDKIWFDIKDWFARHLVWMTAVSVCWVILLFVYPNYFGQIFKIILTAVLYESLAIAFCQVALYSITSVKWLSVDTNHPDYKSITAYEKLGRYFVIGSTIIAVHILFAWVFFNAQFSPN